MQVSSNPSLSVAATADTTNRVAQKALGQDDFLKLLTVQLQQQDPMKPMDDTAFVAQMAQFTSLQQMTAMNKGMEGLFLETRLNAAGGLIGREVTVTQPDGTITTGTVDSVNVSADGPELSIGGKNYPYEFVTRVAPAPTPAPADPAA